jgi:hypothetical protein
VRAFKRDEHLGFEQFGDVGPGTMHRLNELFPAPSPLPPGPPPALPTEAPPLEKRREPREPRQPTSERQAKDEGTGSGKPGPPATPAKVVEINLAGHFVWDPPITDVEELRLFNADNWHPATVDFLSVMGTKTNTGMGNFIAILGEIVARPKGSVSRVNFMTHGNPAMLGIRGRNTSSDVFFDESVTDTEIDQLAQTNQSFTAPNVSGKFTLEAVRARFTKDAIFVLYGCNSGSSPKLLSALHKLLGVKIIGFRNKIVFCPRPAKKGRFVRDGMKIGVNKAGFKCPGDAADKFRDLISDPAAVSNP